MAREPLPRAARSRFLVLGDDVLEQLARLDRFAGRRLRHRGRGRISSLYVDTPELTLARHGLGLRLQRNGRQWQATAEMRHRVSDKLAAGSDREAILPHAPRVPFVLPPGPIEDALRPFVAGRALLPVLAVDVEWRRLELSAAGAKPVGGLQLERVSLRSLSTRHLRTDCEIAVDAAGGAPPKAAALVRSLRRRFPLQPLEGPVFRRGLAFLYGQYLEHDIDAERLRETDSVETAMRRIVTRHLRRLRERDPGTNRGEEAEDLHAMRVASRRLHAALRTFDSGTSRRWSKTMRKELGWLGQLLGTVRDLDVQLARLQHTAPLLSAGRRSQLKGFRDFMTAERERRRQPMQAGLCSARYFDLLLELERFTLGTSGHRRPGSAATTAPVAGVGRRELERVFERLLKQGEKVRRKPSAEGLHALRIEAKRVRYTLEFLKDLMEEPGRRLVKRLIKLQDTLGGFNDAVVAGNFVRAYVEGAGAGSSARALSALGEIVEREEKRAESAEQSFAKVWARFSNPRTAADLDAALASLERRRSRAVARRSTALPSGAPWPIR